MLTITININAETFDDAVMALDEVKSKLNEYYTSGGDSNGENRYFFKVQGEEEEEELEESDL